MAMEAPAMAGAAFLLPGQVNGYGKIVQDPGLQAEVLSGIEGRLARIEERLGQ